VGEEGGACEDFPGHSDRFRSQEHQQMTEEAAGAVSPWEEDRYQTLREEMCFLYR
jgi:hypothetical protein